MKKLNAQTARQKQQQGFTVVQMVVTVAIAMVLLTFGFMGIARARSSMNLTNASEQLTQHLERARQDSARRHATSAAGALPSAERVASVTFVSAGSYTVTMDFDGDGVVEANEVVTFTLPEGVTLPASLITNPAKTLTFDFRGRPSEELTASLTSTYGGQKSISITEAGGVTVEGSHTLTGFAMADVPAPKALSEFENTTATDGGTTTGNGKKDKDGGTTTDTGGTTTGGTTTGGTTTGGTTTGGTTTGGTTTGGTTTGGTTTGGTTTGGTTTGGTTTGGTTTGGTTTGGTTTGGTTTGGTTTGGTTTGGTTTGGTTTGGTTTTTGNGNGNGNGNGGATTGGTTTGGTTTTPATCALNEKPSQTGCTCKSPMRVRTNGKCQ